MKFIEELRVQGQNSRARVLKTAATLTLAEWEQTIADFNGMCAYCDIRPFTALDHFIPFGQEGDGTHVKNCLPICKSCNSSKKDRDIKRIAQKFGVEKIADLQMYLATREPKPDLATKKQKERRPRTPTPTSAEEIRKIKLIGGIDGKKPENGDVVELQGEHGVVYRTIGWISTVYVNYGRPNDYIVHFHPYKQAAAERKH